MRRALGILIWFLLIPSFCIAQEDIADKKSSLVIGGDLLWNSKYKLNEGRGFKRINISLNGKLGYFISDNDLLLLRPRITGEFTSYKSGVTKEEIAFGGEVVYRRFFGSSLFGGVFLGGDWERQYATNYVSGEPQFDKEVYGGLELGYVYFLNPRVGIESALYYSYRRKTVIRDVYTRQHNYSRAGIHIGLLYLFKLKKHTNE
jgi:hypothetical protein